VTPPPLVLLHGLGTGPEAWGPQRVHFEATRRVVTPASWTLDGAFATIDEVVAEAGEVDICGLSLGGVAALTYASSNDRVRRLVVCSAFSHLPGDVRRRVERTSSILAIVPGAVLRRGLASAAPKPWRSAARRALAGVPSHTLKDTLRAVARLDLRPRLACVTSPTLVLCGGDDRHNLPLGRDLAAVLPDARFAVVEGGGHVANLDAPDAFTSLVDEFLH